MFGSTNYRPDICRNTFMKYYFVSSSHYTPQNIYRKSLKPRARGNYVIWQNAYKYSVKICCKSCVYNIKVAFSTQTEPLRRCNLYIFNSKLLLRCCHVDITVKVGYIFRVSSRYYLIHYRFPQNVLVEWLALLLRIREVPGSILGPATAYCVK
jgi:hypothetical protein